MALPTKPIPPDPQSIYQHAYSFLFANHRLVNTEPHYPHFEAIPSLVIIAFANEILFKCIHAMDKSNPDLTDTHRLDILFKRLSNARKKQIIKLWDGSPNQKAIENFNKQSGSTAPTDLPGILLDCGDAFVKLRYFYERPGGSSQLLGTLPDILNKVILETHPEWEIRL